MSTWFDRPLTIAGRVIVRGDDELNPKTLLLHVKRPLLQISNLAIHFNRQVNDGVKLSRQKDMLPILGIVTNELELGNLLMNVICSELSVRPDEILDFDLYLADATPACTFGVHNEFISSGRLDDLSMCFAGLEALLGTPEADTTKVLAIFDNEETGSQTKQGAGSPFLASIIQRIVLAQGETLDDYHRAIEKAFMISADNAHAWHPNYSEKYDPTNHPVLGGGPVIKFNAAQKYASDAVSAAIFAGICEKAGVPCQRFVNHSDIAGGSTLGNILASSLPLKGVDMGNPILGMHSVRETGAAIDQKYCIKAFSEFFKA
jgi:aspartyl aminopeptidase